MGNITKFEKEVRFKLIDMGKTQAWLIQQITDKTGMYCDHSNLRKAMNGTLKASKITKAIEEILGVTYSAGE